MLLMIYCLSSFLLEIAMPISFLRHLPLACMHCKHACIYSLASHGFSTSEFPFPVEGLLSRTSCIGLVSDDGIVPPQLPTSRAEVATVYAERAFLDGIGFL